MNTFPLEILTPQERYFKGEVEALKVICTDGELVILKKHIPLFAALKPGEISLKINGNWDEHITTEGFVIVHPDHVVVFVYEVK